MKSTRCGRRHLTCDPPSAPRSDLLRCRSNPQTTNVPKGDGRYCSIHQHMKRLPIDLRVLMTECLAASRRRFFLRLQRSTTNSITTEEAKRQDAKNQLHQLVLQRQPLREPPPPPVLVLPLLARLNRAPAGSVARNDTCPQKLRRPHASSTTVLSSSTLHPTPKNVTRGNQPPSPLIQFPSSSIISNPPP